MPVEAHRAAHVSLEAFRQRISAARRQTGRLQKELADALGLNPHVLSHKLHGTDSARLTHPEVKQIIKTLASWEAITTQGEAIELLALMGLPPESFASDAWATAPLNQLAPRSHAMSTPAAATEPSHLPRRSRSVMPAPLTPLIGREGLVTLVCDRLRQAEVRLLTLVGPGGVGKTRLSLEVAQQLQGNFADGVYFVALAAIRNPAWVPSALAQVLGITETDTRLSSDLVPAFLADKQILLVLDNVEQVLAAMPFLATMLAAAPALKLLVTSRATLHLSGEHLIGVPPLAFPPLHQLPALMALAQFPAIRLFLERAQAAHASFTLTEQNAPFVAQICHRLDGLPLAIELAAAHSRLFPPRTLVARLDKRLALLAGGPRDLPARQQTLRTTLAWSYDLLATRAQVLFRRLAVFGGGCTLEAIEAVSQALGDGSATVCEGVVSLLDQSLIQQRAADEEARLMMLETIREYGLELLAQHGECEDAQRAHAAYYRALAEAAQPHLRGAEQHRWLTRMEDDHENLRAALEWLLEQAGAEPSSACAEEALQLCATLFWFWYLRGYVSEGQTFLDRALAADTGPPTPARARALYAAGELGFYMNDDYGRVVARCDESVRLFRELGDTRGIAEARYLLGTVAWARSDFAPAHAQLEEALRLFQQLDDTWGRANTLIRLGRVYLDQGDCDQAVRWCEQGLELFRGLGDQQRTAYALGFLSRALFVAQADLRRAQALAEASQSMLTQLGNRQMSTHVGCFLAEMLVAQGEVAQARILAEESVAVHRELADKAATAQTLFCLARIMMAQGDLAAAERHYEESFTCARAIDYQPMIAANLEGLGEVAVAQGDPARAVRRWGNAQALRQAIGAVMHPVYRSLYEQAVAVARMQLDAETFAATWAMGRAMTLEQMITEVDGVRLDVEMTAH